MTVDYVDGAGYGIISCNDCPEEDEFEGDDFSEFFAAAKADGWRARKTDRGWKHQCPACVEAEREENGWGLP